MVKAIINTINLAALLVSLYWANAKGFQAEQLLGVLTALSTLVTLNFETLKSPFVNQQVTIKGSGNKTHQQANAGDSADQRLKIDGDSNEHGQTIL